MHAVCYVEIVRVGFRVDGTGVEHPAEVLRFIPDLWRDALKTSAICNLASMAT
jgi:hypothetical protein